MLKGFRRLDNLDGGCSVLFVVSVLDVSGDAYEVVVFLKQSIDRMCQFGRTCLRLTKLLWLQVFSDLWFTLSNDLLVEKARP